MKSWTWDLREGPHENGPTLHTEWKVNYAAGLCQWVFSWSGFESFFPFTLGALELASVTRDASHCLNSSYCFLPVGSSQSQWGLTEQRIRAHTRVWVFGRTKESNEIDYQLPIKTNIWKWLANQVTAYTLKKWSPIILPCVSLRKKKVAHCKGHVVFLDHTKSKMELCKRNNCLVLLTHIVFQNHKKIETTCQIHIEGFFSLGMNT